MDWEGFGQMWVIMEQHRQERRLGGIKVVWGAADGEEGRKRGKREEVLGSGFTTRYKGSLCPISQTVH